MRLITGNEVTAEMLSASMNRITEPMKIQNSRLHALSSLPESFDQDEKYCAKTNAIVNTIHVEYTSERPPKISASKIEKIEKSK
jgi:hypothetical protein